MTAVRWRHSGNAMNFFSSPKPTLRLSRELAQAFLLDRADLLAHYLESCEVGHSSASAATKTLPRCAGL
jgi:hypothetical protein